MAHSPACSCRRCDGDVRADAADEIACSEAAAYLRRRVAGHVAETVHVMAEDAMIHLGMSYDDPRAEAVKDAARAVLDRHFAPAKPPAPTGGSPREGSGGTPYTAGDLASDIKHELRRC